MAAQCLQGLLWQALLWAVEFHSFVPGIDLHPVDFFTPHIGLLHGRIDHTQHHWRDIHASAVTLNVGDDGVVGHIQGVVGIDFDGLARSGDLDVLVGCHL